MTVCASCGHESAEEFAFCPRCGTPVAAPAAPREQRKVVTVLFCDLSGSTELGETLDPEALRALLARYFEQMKAIVERHGGTVEKFIGDAVMAVFGVPVVHEDDALRAVRAALEMRDSLPELGIQGRIGITTGEVVTGTEERLATGDAVNVAARLESAAQPGEILIGDETYRLVRGVAGVDAVEPLALKGKTRRVTAYRLLSVHGEAPRRLDVPMVGREREQQLLAGAWDRVVSERFCHLFTVLGAAGVGKSRLVAEFLASLDEALVVRGRCLPYGEGITYWPVVEVVKQLPPAELEPAAAAAMQVVAGDGDLATTSDEIAWAFRKLLEAVAAERPLVCVFDDIQWGEETFLDLIEHVADLSRNAPILLLCMARPDLLDRRTGWAGGKVNATNVLLEPLGPAETDLLIERLAHFDEGLRERIREAAEGNPLFVEEMVALAQESDGGEVTVPPTIQALLAARLDQLDVPERSVLERGSVEGRLFHRGAVQALAPEESEVAARLTSLVRKELVRPDKAQLRGEDAYRFRHLLIRDAAYDGLPKSIRADLHERFALWLEEHGTGLVELDEILGYHLEQAWKYRKELGEDERPLAERARVRLASAARRAMQRGDFTTALGLLERALALVGADRFDLPLELDRMDVLFMGGRIADAHAEAGEVVLRARAAGDLVWELTARIKEAQIRLSSEPDRTAELDALIGQALPVLDASGDDFALCVAYGAVAGLANYRAQVDTALRACEVAVRHAGRTGLPHLEKWLLPARAANRYHGSTPVDELLAWIDDQDPTSVNARLQDYRAAALGLLGRFEEGRAILSATRAAQAERGAVIDLAIMLSQHAAVFELTAGDAAAAASLGEEGCGLLEEAGDRGWLSTGAGYLALSLCILGRFEEAEAWADRGLDLGAGDDALTQLLALQAKANVRAHQGLQAEAETLAREAVEIADATELTSDQGRAYLDLAAVLERGGKEAEAAAAVEQALARFERKGSLALAAQARARLEQLL